MMLGRRSLWLLAATCLAAPAAAQQVADSATREVLRQQERERVLREQQEMRPDVRLESPVEEGSARLPTQETPCFRIERILLEGEDANDFQWALRAANPRKERPQYLSSNFQ